MSFVTAIKSNIKSNNLCGICFEKMGDSKSVKTLHKINEITHQFHNKCIAPWLRIKKECPTCRFDVSLILKEEEKEEKEKEEKELQAKIRELELFIDLNLDVSARRVEFLEYAARAGRMDLFEKIFTKKEPILVGKPDILKLAFVRAVTQNLPSLMEKLFSIHEIPQDALDLAVFWATKKNRPEILTLLLTKGALSIEGQLRAVYVDIAVNQGKMTPQLLDANRNTSSEQLAAIFCEAAKEGCTELVELMLFKYVISIQTQINAINEAEQNDQENVINFLIQKAAMNVTLHTSKDELVFIFSWAARVGDIDSIKQLLQRGIISESIRSIAICFAAEKGRKEIVELLLQKGGISSRSLKMAIQEAEENGCEEIALLLKKHQKCHQISELASNAALIVLSWVTWQFYKNYRS